MLLAMAARLAHISWISDTDGPSPPVTIGHAGNACSLAQEIGSPFCVYVAQAPLIIV